jgi:hypothetical protein
MSDVPVEELLAQIQRHLDARQGVRASEVAALPHGDRFSTTVYDSLEEASAVMDTIRVAPFVSPAHLPVVGGVWQKARGLAHGLVVYYVNRLAGVQGVFNREITAAVTALVADLDRDGRADAKDDMLTLRAELAALRAQVAALEATSVHPDRSPEGASCFVA